MNRGPVSRAVFVVAVVSLLALGGCPGCGSDVEFLSQGDGPANAAPLWPLGEGARPALRLNITDELIPPLDALTVHSQRRVDDGVEHRFDRGFAQTSTGLAVKVTDDGDIYLTAAQFGVIEPPMLLVPATVRKGMSWRLHRRLEEGTVAAGTDQVSDEPAVVELDDDTWTFTVTERAEVATGIAWRIEWVGPLLPHVKDAAGEGTDRHIEGLIEFVEGAGPDGALLHVHSMDTIRSTFLSPEAQTPSPFRDPGSSTQLSPVAGDSPQTAPRLTSSPSSSSPLAMAPRLLHLARSGREDNSELFMHGVAVGANSFIDPNGGNIRVAVPTAVLSCGFINDVGGGGGAFPPAQCPAEFMAPLYVHPDGTRFDHRSPLQLTSAGLVDSTDINRFARGFEAMAPFRRDAHLLSLGVNVGFGTFDPRLRLRTFDTNFAPILDYFVQGDGPGAADGAELFALTEPLPFIGPGEVFTVPFDDGTIAVVGVSGLNEIAVRDGRPLGEVVWLSADGHVLRRADLHLSRPAVAHRDGAYVLTDMGQLGELRRVHVEVDGVWAELLGHVDLPGSAIAGGAVEVSPDRYLVMTQDSPELSYVPTELGYENELGMTQKPSTGTNGFVVVTAPPTGIVDRDFALRHLDVRVGVGVVRVCVPARSGFVVDAVRLGTVDVAAADLRRVDDDCLEVAIAKGSITSSWTSIGLHIADVGWVLRSRPPPPTFTAPAIAATLSDGRKVTPTSTISRFDVERLPRADTVPELPNLALDGSRAALVSGARTFIVDGAGAGLWATLGFNAGIARCHEVPGLIFDARLTMLAAAGFPCVDDDVPEHHVAWVLLDGDGNHTFWAPPGLIAAADGGVIGSIHLDVDGTITAVPGFTDNVRALRQARLGGGGDPAFVFRDGTVCGEVNAPNLDVVVGCMSAGTLTLMDLPPLSTLPPISTWVAQSPGKLVIFDDADNALEVLVADVATGAVRRQPIGAGRVQHTLGSDGTRWSVVGAPTSQRVGVKNGIVEIHTLTDVDDVLYAATATEVLWASGLVTPRDEQGVDCVAVDEVCNGVDDDCDDDIDEGDTALCAQDNGLALCVAGACAVQSCTVGFDDCNDSADDGCETPLTTTTDCLACDTACAAGTVCTVDGCGLPPAPQLVAGSDFICSSDPVGVHCFGGPNVANSLTHPWSSSLPIAAGSGHVCALDDATVSCFGRSTPALGAGVVIGSAPLEPVVVADIDDAVALFAGGGTTCVRHRDETISCLGDLVAGLVDVDGFDDEARFDALKTATPVPVFAGAVDLVLSAARGCARFVTGDVICAGPVVVDGVTAFVQQPLSLPPVTSMSAATSSSSSSSFAFITAGAVYGLGALAPIEALGGPAPATVYVDPVELQNISAARHVVLGTSHACAIDDDAVRCSGSSNAGQLGIAGSDISFVSFGVTPGAFVAGVATSTSTCIVDDQREVRCTGALLAPLGGPRFPFRVVNLQP